MEGVKTIGIVGGGQLGRMLTLAAKPLGFHVIVVDPNVGCSASQVGAEQIVAAWQDEQALQELCKRADYVTIEVEHIDTTTLARLAEAGQTINPSPATIRLIQDKYEQKVFLRQAGIPVAPFVAIESISQAKKALKNYDGKMLLKTRRDAYDGRGNALVSSEADLTAAMKRFAGKSLYAEAFVPFIKELAVMVARGIDGSIKTYPVVETFHKRNICEEVHAPAQIDKSIADKAQRVALKVAQQLQGAGMFGIEMFLTADGEILINEIAPRVHNSGHYTTEACATSQFEQHIRAISGLPLGETTMSVPAAVMINILGERDGETNLEGAARALAVPHTSLHLYGKYPTKPDRKMGHITSTGKTVAEARKRATLARKHMKV